MAAFRGGPEALALLASEEPVRMADLDAWARAGKVSLMMHAKVSIDPPQRGWIVQADTFRGEGRHLDEAALNAVRRWYRAAAETADRAAAMGHSPACPLTHATCCEVCGWDLHERAAS